MTSHDVLSVEPALLTWADPFYPDGVLPQSVRAALRKQLDEPAIVHYTDADGSPSLRAAIARWFTRSTHVPCDADHVIVTAGSTTALYFAMSVLLHPGDEVIVTDPGFPDYVSDCRRLGLIARGLPLLAEDGYQIREPALESVISERTRAIVLANPLNPMTTVLDRVSCETIATVAARHDLLVINDEAFADHVFGAGAAGTLDASRISAGERPFVSLASMPQLRSRCLTVRSLSKGYGLSGLRIGALIGASGHAATSSGYSTDLIAQLRPLVEDQLGAPPTFAQIAAEAALDDESLLPSIRAEFTARAALVREILGAVDGVRVTPIDSGFLSWIDVSAFGGGDVVARALREQAGIAVQPGSHYVLCGALSDVAGTVVADDHNDHAASATRAGENAATDVAASAIARAEREAAGFIRISQGAYRDRDRLAAVLRRLAATLASLR